MGFLFTIIFNFTIIVKIKNMKVVIKEITKSGSDLLVYLMTDSNQSISCEITTKENLNQVIKTITNNLKEIPQVNYPYAQYIKQDESN